MKKVSFEIEEGLAIITLNAPPLNLIDAEALRDMEECVSAIEGSTVRAVLLCSEGTLFSAGVDVENMFKSVSQEGGYQLISKISSILKRFEALPIPTIASVHGMCLAGGFEMALACDIIWASEDAQMGLVEAVIGAVPFGGGIQRLASRAGIARAKEVVISARTFNAETMADWGVINRVLPSETLREKSKSYAKKLAQGPTQAYSALKKVLRVYANEGLSRSDELLAELTAPLFETQDMQHGIVSLLKDGPGKATFHNQ